MFAKGDVVIHKKIGIPYTVRFVIGPERSGDGKEYIALEEVVNGIWGASSFKYATEYRRLKLKKIKKRIKYKKLFKLIDRLCLQKVMK